MAGFRNVIPHPLGISATGTQAGFVSVLPILSLGGTAGVTQAGYYSIVPVLPLGGTTVVGGTTDGRKRRTYFTMIGRTRLGR